uniref:Uncharacterized protein n=1 Tax=Drosophila pseudoobscura pseudoobscura TaxID=46245 RepID=A0A0R3NVX5_DROPS
MGCIPATRGERLGRVNWQPLDYEQMDWLSAVPTNCDVPNPETMDRAAGVPGPGNPYQPKGNSDLSLGLDESVVGCSQVPTS